LGDAHLVPADLGNGPGRRYDAPEGANANHEPWFDDDAAVVLNERMPVSAWAAAAQNSALAPNLRRRLALAGWVRAALLNDVHSALALADAVKQVAPELAPAIEQYRSAPVGAKRFAAVFAVLHNPGLRPDVQAGVGRTLPLAE